MGSPKPLLKWGEHTLIEHQIHTLLETGSPIVVVLGSDADLIQPLIEELPVAVVVNGAWAEGMGSSIAVGVSHLAGKFPQADGVLITLVDQPLLTAAHLDQLGHAFQPGSKEIIVSRSPSGYMGVPVVFDRFYLDSLQALKGDEGAKKVIRQHTQSVKTVDCEELLDDLDTLQDYRRLLEHQRK
jgi:molybdenum cofactor cytidylyltransferase